MDKIMANTFEGKPCKKCGSTTRLSTGSKQCINCKNAARNRWKERNPNYREKYKYWGLSYGLQRGQAEDLFEKQNKSCAICKTTESSKWCVDHSHTTGLVRGILCHHCNVLIGMAKENINTLKNSIDYLEKYSK